MGKLIRGDPGRPDGWIPPDHVTEQEEEMSPEIPQVEREHQLLLFHLEDDPCEAMDLAAEYPAITRYLASLLDTYQAGMVTPDLGDLDTGGNPSNFGNMWSTGWCNITGMGNML